ncbi:putative membrane protein [Sphingomonas zeicaulis]|uniref:PH domain-containing protein n=1 Tax=Sphingomonas zeicaulis TaxID=1632740 RepID=UPI003D1D2713
MSMDEVADRRLHPGTALIGFIKGLPQMVVVLPLIATRASGMGWHMLLPIAAGAAGLLGLLAWLRWRQFRYGIGTDGLVIEHGLIGRTRRTIPFDRIQDVDIERRPLHRLFGLARVRVETGAAGRDEGVLDSVSLAEADRLRTAIRAAREVAPDPVTPAIPQPVERRRDAVFAMTLPRVLLLGLFNFSLVYLAAIFAVLNSVDDFLPFDLYDPGFYLDFARDRVRTDAPTPLLVLAGVSVAVLLGVLAGVARSVSREFGFRLAAEAGGFRRERGLFTRSEVVIAARRIQLGLVESGPIRGGFGWSALLMQTLGEGSKGEGGRQAAAPLANDAEVADILAAARILRLPGSDGLQPVSRGHIWRALLPRVGPLSLAILFGGLFLPWVWGGFVMVLLIAASTILERRRHRYRMDGDMLFIQRGWWRRRLWLVPVQRIQVVGLQRGWLQRRLGLASVVTDVAGGSILSNPIVEDLRESDARALFDTLRAAALRR